MISLVSGNGPSVTSPSVDTMLAFWLSSPAPKTHTPASLASRTTSVAALVTTGKFSSVSFIQPSSNEIRYRVIHASLSPGDILRPPLYLLDERLPPDSTPTTRAGGSGRWR